MSGASGTVRVRFPIAATPELRERIDARDHEAVRRSMEPLLAPRSVAVIGASSRRGSIGGELFRNMLDARFARPCPSREPDGRSGGGPRCVQPDRRYRRSGRPGRRMRSRSVGRRAGARGTRRRDAQHLRDHGRILRERRRRAAAGAPPAGAGAIARGAIGGPELPGDRRAGAGAECDLRARRLPARNDRLLIAERRAGARRARARPAPGPGTVRVRLGREQGGRVLQRSDGVVGRRSGYQRGDAVHGVVRQPAQVRASGPPGLTPQAGDRPQGRRDQGRCQGGRIAYRSPCRLGHGGRCPVPPGRRDQGANARGADRSCGVAVTPTVARGAAGGCADKRGRTGDPVRRRMRGVRTHAARADGCVSPQAPCDCCRPRQASRTPSTCLARRPPPATAGLCQCWSPTRTWMP